MSQNCSQHRLCKPWPCKPITAQHKIIAWSSTRKALLHDALLLKLVRNDLWCSCQALVGASQAKCSRRSCGGRSTMCVQGHDHEAMQHRWQPERLLHPRVASPSKLTAAGQAAMRVAARAAVAPVCSHQPRIRPKSCAADRRTDSRLASSQ